MEPVEQRLLWRPDDHPDGPQRGDCVRACVASIFEVPYEKVESIQPGGDSGDLRAWVKDRHPGVEPLHRLLVPLHLDRPEQLDDLDSWPTSHYHPGYWIAAIKSPRIPAREAFGCGCTESVPDGDPDCRWCEGEPGKRSMGIEWGLHAVVMHGGVVAWDPHPEAEDRDPDEPILFYSATTFVVVDPSLIRRPSRKVDYAESI